MHFKSTVYITLILGGLQEGNWKDNTVDDSEGAFTTTKHLYALFTGQAGTTALKLLCSHVLAAFL